MLQAALERWPERAGVYLALSDEAAMAADGDPLPEGELERAIEGLEQGLARVGREDLDREILEERLLELRRRGRAVAP